MLVCDCNHYSSPQIASRNVISWRLLGFPTGFHPFNGAGRQDFPCVRCRGALSPVSLTHLAAGETHACLGSPLWSYFKQFLFGMRQPRATYTMSKKGLVAFTSMQTSYMETNPVCDRVPVRSGFHAARSGESSSWNEPVSFALLLRLLWRLKALKLLNTLAFQPFTKRAPSHSALQGCAQFSLSRR